jgi:hypothetical protein
VDQYDARFRVMGESSRFILTARVEDDNAANAEAALARIWCATIGKSAFATTMMAGGEVSKAA